MRLSLSLKFLRWCRCLRKFELRGKWRLSLKQRIAKKNSLKQREGVNSKVKVGSEGKQTFVHEPDKMMQTLHALFRCALAR